MMFETLMIVTVCTLPLNSGMLSWTHQTLDSEGPLLAHFSVVFPFLGRISWLDIWISCYLSSRDLLVGKG